MSGACVIIPAYLFPLFQDRPGICFRNIVILVMIPFTGTCRMRRSASAAQQGILSLFILFPHKMFPKMNPAMVENTITSAAYTSVFFAPMIR